MTAAPIILPYKGIMPKIDPTAFIAPGAAIIGDVTIGPEANVWFGAVLRGDDHSITVGEGASIQDGAVVHVTLKDSPTVIGKNAVVAHGVKLHGCTLGEGCLVGIGAIVLDNAIIEPGAFVAAGALVAPGKTVPSGELWGGSPARKLRDLRPADREYMVFDAAHYRRLTAEYRAAQAAAE